MPNLSHNNLHITGPRAVRDALVAELPDNATDFFSTHVPCVGGDETAVWGTYSAFAVKREVHDDVFTEYYLQTAHVLPYLWFERFVSQFPELRFELTGMCLNLGSFYKLVGDNGKATVVGLPEEAELAYRWMDAGDATREYWRDDDTTADIDPTLAVRLISRGLADSKDRSPRSIIELAGGAHAIHYRPELYPDFPAHAVMALVVQWVDGDRLGVPSEVVGHEPTHGEALVYVCAYLASRPEAWRLDNRSLLEVSLSWARGRFGEVPARYAPLAETIDNLMPPRAPTAPWWRAAMVWPNPGLLVAALCEYSWRRRDRVQLHREGGQPRAAEPADFMHDLLSLRHSDAWLSLPRIDYRLAMQEALGPHPELWPAPFSDWEWPGIDRPVVPEYPDHILDEENYWTCASEPAVPDPCGTPPAASNGHTSGASS